MGTSQLTIPPRDELYDHYYNDGKKLQQVADHYDVSYSTARNWLIKHDIDRRGRGPTIDAPEIPPEDELRDLYHNSLRMMDDVAAEYSVTRQDVIDWFDERNIESKRAGAQSYYPFDGSVDDAVQFLRQNPDRVIRFYPGEQVNCNKLYYDDGFYLVRKAKSDKKEVDPDGPFLASFFEVYEPEVVSRDQYAVIPDHDPE